jgi:DNA helicase-2/ATP-dependent DNA helicase PcrA
MEEERRLCYVGITRARKRLFLSLSQSRSLFGELRFNPPSRFLREVPQELFDFGSGQREQLRQPAAVPPTYRRGAGGGGRYDEYSQVPRSQPAPRSDGPRIEYDGDEGDIRGRKVRHAQFGEGVVLEVDGEGPNAKLTVKFPQVGLKRVVARFLQPV